MAKTSCIWPASPVAIYTLLRLLQRPTLGRAIVHGLYYGLAVDVRVQGLLLLVVSLLMLGLEALTEPEPS